MSGKCGPTLVAVAAPDNWTFLGKPDEQAVDFFHACEHLGEVADRRDRLVRPRHPARRTVSTRSAIRYLRDKATTKTAVAVLERELRLFRRHRRRRRYASLKARGCTLRRRRSCEQGAGQPAHEAGALERRRRPERPHLQGDVGPFRRRVADDDRNVRRERQPECCRSLTAEISPLQTKPECQI